MTLILTFKITRYFTRTNKATETAPDRTGDMNHEPTVKVQKETVAVEHTWNYIRSDNVGPVSFQK